MLTNAPPFIRPVRSSPVCRCGQAPVVGGRRMGITLTAVPELKKAVTDPPRTRTGFCFLVEQYGQPQARCHMVLPCSFRSRVALDFPSPFSLPLSSVSQPRRALPSGFQPTRTRLSGRTFTSFHTRRFFPRFTCHHEGTTEPRPF